MSHNCMPESFFPPAVLSRGLLAEALLTIRLQEWVDGVKNRLSPLSFPGLGSSGMVQTHCQTGGGSVSELYCTEFPLVQQESLWRVNKVLIGPK